MILRILFFIENRVIIFLHKKVENKQVKIVLFVKCAILMSS